MSSSFQIAARRRQTLANSLANKLLAMDEDDRREEMREIVAAWEDYAGPWAEAKLSDPPRTFARNLMESPFPWVDAGGPTQKQVDRFLPIESPLEAVQSLLLTEATALTV